MKKLALLMILIFVLAGCGNNKEQEESTISYKDGEYTAQSDPDDWGGKIVLRLTVKDGKIETCEQDNLDSSGQEKNEEYGKIDGKISNPGLYKIAQGAVEATKEYPNMLIDKQDINKVEVISGATVSHKCFTDAVNRALEDAKE
ncbi:MULTISPECIES: FMN-binding protein [Peptoniphilus]|uniref:FMN-binding protein n=1 Tax=Peptoniphilus TaxID=162289 RepID=UPI0001DA9A90|nr:MULTISPECIES: FMN-binding protein [Peptoniphilus]EFI41962.1 FMN-binding domain protein [Peptoniphilus sp. oral taxon 386 str. F0131]